MLFFNFKRLFIILLVIVIPLLFLSISKSDFERNPFYKAGTFITHKTRLFFSSYTSSIQKTISHYLFLLQVKKNVYQLKNENTRLKIKLMQMEAMEQENDRLSRMLKFARKKTFQLIPVQIISLDPFPEYYLVTVNKGSKDGIKKNMGVITEQGVVGYISRVNNNTSQVLLLSDRDAVMPVKIQRSRISSIIEGRDHKTLFLRYIKNEDDVRINDQVVTSGIDQSLPPGIPVGFVLKIKKEKYGSHQEVIVRPYVSLGQIEELFVIVR